MSNRSKIERLSDEELVPLILKGNATAFEFLYERYFNILFSFSLSYTRNEAISEDIVHDLFLEMTDKLKSYNSGYKLRSWLFTLTANQCKNHIRNIKTRERLNDEIGINETSTTGIGSSIDGNILRQHISEVLENYEPEEQELFKMRFYSGLKVNEIAEVIGIAEGTVKSRLFHLTKKVRNALKGYYHEYRK